MHRHAQAQHSHAQEQAIHCTLPWVVSLCVRVFAGASTTKTMPLRNSCSAMQHVRASRHSLLLPLLCFFCFFFCDGHLEVARVVVCRYPLKARLWRVVGACLSLPMALDSWSALVVPNSVSALGLTPETIKPVFVYHLYNIHYNYDIPVVFFLSFYRLISTFTLSLFFSTLSDSLTPRPEHEASLSSVCVCVCVCLSVRLSVCLSVCLSVSFCLCVNV